MTLLRGGELSRSDKKGENSPIGAGNLPRGAGNSPRGAGNSLRGAGNSPRRAGNSSRGAGNSKKSWRGLFQNGELPYARFKDCLTAI